MYTVRKEDAQKMWDWLQNRGGLAIWSSIDLSDLGRSWTTPLRTAAGELTTKPHWKVGNEPSRIITDPSEVEVVEDKEVKRFRVGIGQSGNGLTLKVTVAGSRHIHREVVKAGKDAYYVFDYVTQEAVIMAPASKAIPLTEYIKNLEGK